MVVVATMTVECHRHFPVWPLATEVNLNVLNNLKPRSGTIALPNSKSELRNRASDSWEGSE